MRPGASLEVAAGMERPTSEAAPPAVSLAVWAEAPSPSVAAKRTLGAEPAPKMASSSGAPPAGSGEPSAPSPSQESESRATGTAM